MNSGRRSLLPKVSIQKLLQLCLMGAKLHPDLAAELGSTVRMALVLKNESYMMEGIVEYCNTVERTAAFKQCVNNTAVKTMRGHCVKLWSWNLSYNGDAKIMGLKEKLSSPGKSGP